MKTHGLVRFIGSLVALVGFAGCASLTLQQPANNSTVPAPVAVRGDFRLNVNNSLTLELDGVDITHSVPFATQIDYAALCRMESPPGRTP